MKNMKYETDTEYEHRGIKFKIISADMLDFTGYYGVIEDGFMLDCSSTAQIAGEEIIELIDRIHDRWEKQKDE